MQLLELLRVMKNHTPDPAIYIGGDDDCELLIYNNLMRPLNTETFDEIKKHDLRTLQVRIMPEFELFKKTFHRDNKFINWPYDKPLPEISGYKNLEKAGLLTIRMPPDQDYILKTLSASDIEQVYVPPRPKGFRSYFVDDGHDGFYRSEEHWVDRGTFERLDDAMKVLDVTKYERGTIKFPEGEYVATTKDGKWDVYPRYIHINVTDLGESVMWGLGLFHYA